MPDKYTDKQAEAYCITTPIYYVNSKLHVGGAYTTVAADVLARYNRLKGNKVFFLTGSDEHGQKIQETAKTLNIDSKTLADKNVAEFKNLWCLMKITNDDFVRTTEPRHELAVKTFFAKIMEKGDIYKGVYKGLYCVPCERYLTNSQLEEGKCPVCKREPGVLEEENYFLRMSEYQKKLLRLIEDNPTFIEPQNRRNEVMSRVRTGLEDVSVSRSTGASWGISIPQDPSHVIWVWVDALINYLTGLGYPNNTEKFQIFWHNTTHLVGKDIIWFHCVIWPCLLMAAGIEPPRKIFAHGWWTINGEKISKSKDNMIYPEEIISKYGLDPLRYFLLREIPFGADGDFSYEALERRINSDLADGLGNLLARSTAMVWKYSGGKLPVRAGKDTPLAEAAKNLFEKIDKAFDSIAFHTVLEEIMIVIRRANKFVEETQPWTLAKNQKTEELSNVLAALMETLRIVSWALEPFMPDTCGTIRQQLGVQESGRLEDLLSYGRMAEGTQLKKGGILFKKTQ
ncbi:MAG: methionine--tRNA ligase [Planctomycetota bacterium]